MVERSRGWCEDAVKGIILSPGLGEPLTKMNALRLYGASFL